MILWGNLSTQNQDCWLSTYENVAKCDRVIFMWAWVQGLSLLWWCRHIGVTLHDIPRASTLQISLTVAYHPFFDSSLQVHVLHLVSYIQVKHGNLIGNALSHPKWNIMLEFSAWKLVQQHKTTRSTTSTTIRSMKTLRKVCEMLGHVSFYLHALFVYWGNDPGWHLVGYNSKYGMRGTEILPKKLAIGPGNGV